MVEISCEFKILVSGKNLSLVIPIHEIETLKIIGTFANAWILFHNEENSHINPIKMFTIEASLSVTIYSYMYTESHLRPKLQEAEQLLLWKKKIKSAIFECLNRIWIIAVIFGFECKSDAINHKNTV